MAELGEGSVVTLDVYLTDDGSRVLRRTVRLGSSGFSKLDDNMLAISVDSPIGRGLLGSNYAKGDILEYKVSNSTRKAKIIEIRE